MKVCFTVWLLLLAAGCSVKNSAKTPDIQRNTVVPSIASKAPDKSAPVKNVDLKTKVFKNADSKIVDCDDPNGFSLVVVPDPERESQDLGTVPTILNIVAEDEIRVALKVPTDSDAQNFLMSTEKTKEGFEITIEYGVRYYFRKQLNFVCKAGNFYLYRVRVEGLYDAAPKSRASWHKEQKLKPNVPIEKFSIFDYL